MNMKESYIFSRILSGLSEGICVKRPQPGALIASESSKLLAILPKDPREPGSSQSETRNINSECCEDLGVSMGKHVAPEALGTRPSCHERTVFSAG